MCRGAYSGSAASSYVTAGLGFLGLMRGRCLRFHAVCDAHWVALRGTLPRALEEPGPLTRQRNHHENSALTRVDFLCDARVEARRSTQAPCASSRLDSKTPANADGCLCSRWT